MAIIEQIKHPSNVKGRKRIARGTGSTGAKSGRGQKGQKSRSGSLKAASFEGGRTPVVRKFPKIGGFKHHSKIYYHAVNLGRLAETEEGTIVDLMYLEMQGLLPKKLRNLKVKLLGDGEFAKKLTFKLHAFSHSARARVEAAGGVCEVIE